MKLSLKLTEALKLYEKQKFLETLEKIELLTVMASGNQMEPKINLLKAHTEGRLKGTEIWKKSLIEVATTFSAFDEGVYAKEIVDKIDELEKAQELRVIYKNYKWVFPFKKSEIEKAERLSILLKESLSEENKGWTLSIDTYNIDYIFVVVHGIRDPKNIDFWKVKNQFKLSSLLEEQNFVTLASQYRDYIKNKTWNKDSK
jgi:hypothetical protein